MTHEYYQALLDKDAACDGIFCHPTCPARKPKFENGQFFETAQAAMQMAPIRWRSLFRVIALSARMVYGGGLARKQWLLQHEKLGL